MKILKVFICFDITNDEKLKDSLVEQAENPDSPFEVTGWSDKDIEEEETLKRIKNCDGMIVIVGLYTFLAESVKKEVKIASNLGIPIAQITEDDGNYTSLKDAGGMYSWTWENIKEISNSWSRSG